MPGIRKNVAVVFHSVKDQPFGAMVEQDMVRGLGGHPEISAEYADPEGDPDRQVRVLERFLDARVDALVVLPIEPEKTRRVLRRYRAAGIPVIGVDNDLGEPDLFRALILADNRQFGQKVGEFFVEVMEGRGEIVEIAGVASTSAAIDRSAGFRDAIVTSPGLRIVERCVGDWMHDKARKELGRVLARHRRIDGVFAQNDEMARGACDAAAAVGREQELLITGIDAIRGEKGIQLVMQGRMAATFINPSPGRAAVDALLETLSGGRCVEKRLLRTSPLRSPARIRAWQAARER